MPDDLAHPARIGPVRRPARPWVQHPHLALHPPVFHPSLTSVWSPPSLSPQRGIQPAQIRVRLRPLIQPPLLPSPSRPLPPPPLPSPQARAGRTHPRSVPARPTHKFYQRARSPLAAPSGVPQIRFTQRAEPSNSLERNAEGLAPPPGPSPTAARWRSRIRKIRYLQVDVGVPHLSLATFGFCASSRPSNHDRWLSSLDAALSSSDKF